MHQRRPSRSPTPTPSKSETTLTWGNLPQGQDLLPFPSSKAITQTHWSEGDTLFCENLDIGRPSQAQLIVERRVSRRTPGRFRTRVITEGVIPSLHVDYKSSRIKHYHKSPQTAWSFRSHFSEAQLGTAGFGAHRAAICWGILGRWMVLHNVGRAGYGISAVYFR